jgi:hypothetical protein
MREDLIRKVLLVGIPSVWAVSWLFLWFADSSTWMTLWHGLWCVVSMACWLVLLLRKDDEE